MYCDECKRRPATVHVTKIINGQMYEGHLCAECAHRDQMHGVFQTSFAIPNFLAALFNLNPQAQEDLATGDNSQACEKCGLSFEQITKLGRLGCNECYAKFADKMEPLLRRIHGSTQHPGKVPQRRGGIIRQKKEISQLRLSLQQLIAKEEFEKAAAVRDEIRKLEQALEG